MASDQPHTPRMPAAIYVWLVPSEEMLDQPGSWRIRKWDTAPFPEANFTLAPSSETKEWLIWSNEHGAWWGADRSGYYSDADSAGRYTIAEARSICRVRSWDGGVPPETMIHEKDAKYGK